MTSKGKLRAFGFVSCLIFILQRKEKPKKKKTEGRERDRLIKSKLLALLFQL